MTGDEHTGSGGSSGPGRESNVVALRPRTDSQHSQQPSGAASEQSSTPEHGAAGAAAPQPIGASLEQQIEALLFVSPTPLTTEQLAECTQEDPDELHDCLIDMMQAWGEGQRGIVLERVAGGWAFRASDRCQPQLQRLSRPQGDTRLSPSAIESP